MTDATHLREDFEAWFNDNSSFPTGGDVHYWAAKAWQAATERAAKKCDALAELCGEASAVAGNACEDCAAAIRNGGAG